MTDPTGEVVGLAGLQGSGRTELAQSIFGVTPFKTGTVELFGKPVAIGTPAAAIGLGLGLVTEDRKASGILPNQPVRDNILLTVRALQNALTQIRRDGVGRAPSLVPTLAERVDVRVTSHDQEVQFLSGGNQQKVVLAKWLETEPAAIIFDEPTRGIDVGARFEIYQLMRRLTDSGVAILMISSDLPEILGMSDRILVMHDGAIAGELSRAAATEESIIELATTGALASAHAEQGVPA